MGGNIELDVISSPQLQQKNLCCNKFFCWFHLCTFGFWHKKNKDDFDSDVVSDDKPKMGKDTFYEFKEILIINNKNFDKKISGTGGSIFKGPLGVPENPEFTVGLDKQLIKLKMELLRDGKSTLLLTGLGGMGKTTLATKLCWDQQVKGKS